MKNETKFNESKIKEKISESLKKCRKNFKQTQGEVAEGIGIMQQAYYKYESGRAVPSAVVIFKLADEYNVSADYLLGLTDEPRPLKRQTQKIVTENPNENKNADNTYNMSLRDELDKIKSALAANGIKI